MMRSWLFAGSPVRLMTRGVRQLFRHLFRNSFRYQLTQLLGQSAPKKGRLLKDLMKEYGYLALGVYLGLLMIDLPLCYLLVHSQGKDEIEYYENKVKQKFGYGMSDDELKAKQAREQAESAKEEQQKTEDTELGVVAFVKRHFSWTEFAIAYGIHKSLIFIRVPLCAAITPSIVKILRGWGFKIGSGTSAAVAKGKFKDAAGKVQDYTALSPQFGQPAGKRKWWWFF